MQKRIEELESALAHREKRVRSSEVQLLDAVETKRKVASHVACRFGFSPPPH
jgi:hypothetical protein